MRLGYLFCACVLILVFHQSYAHETDKPVALEQDFVLSKAQQIDLASKAMDGSVDAAKKLSLYYSNVRLDLEKGMYWAVIGAENGDASLQYDAYVFLKARASTDEQKRALFWLKKSANQGFPRAVDALHAYKLDNPQ